MKNETGENPKPRSQYVDDAVQLAIAGKWEEAIKLNKLIIETFGPAEEVQNRLGKALSELGKYKEAKAAYEAALKLNPQNGIAKKNAMRIDALIHQKDGLKGGPSKVDLNLFVEEMGKTVTTTLDAHGDKDLCSRIAAGDLAELRIERAGIVAETARGIRLGGLESKLARRLIKFMNGGNRYQAGVMSCDNNTVKLIIRETYQDPKFAGKPSFAMKRKRETEFRPYTKESLISREVEAFTDDDGEVVGEAAVATDEVEDGMQVVEDDAEPGDFAEEEAASDNGDDDDEDNDK